MDTHLYFYLSKILEQISCEILTLKMLCLFCWSMRKFLEGVSINIKFLFSYFLLGTLFRWKKCHDIIMQIMQLHYQRKDVSSQFSLGKNCPDIEIQSQGWQKKFFFPCLMFRTRRDATIQAWIWVRLIEWDAVPFF